MPSMFPREVRRQVLRISRGGYYARKNRPLSRTALRRV